MSRIAKDQAYHETELDYLKNAWPGDKGSFRNNQAVFNEYIEMQAGFARADGFPVIADNMLGYRQFVPHGKRNRS